MATRDTSVQSFLSGFTIIELIVVISVIGILATIAVVSYSGAQNRAKRSSFESNAQQVKLKLGDYLTDKNGYPRTKTDVATYLGSSTMLGGEFTKADYVYNASGCPVAPGLCTGYSITVDGASYGIAGDVIEVKP